jgi:choline dehydrogenase
LQGQGRGRVNTADFIIVGAGSAGCVLANRLSEDPRNRVVLIEAGGDDRPLRNPRQFLSNLMIHTPVGFASTLTDPRVNWLYRTEPDATSGGRCHPWPRGKVLGGSSSINGLLYVRGQAEDYDGWANLGCHGWGYRDVLPYFRRAENQERGACEWHGAGGPLHVSDQRDRHPIAARMLEAGVEAGIPRSNDINGACQEGISWFQCTIRDGRRHSAAVAYLHPAMKRPNLHVETNAHATRLLLEGRRATGVEFERNGERHLLRAQQEVILAAGAIGSPQLLELSGIGRPELLRSRGIEVVHALPGVGENLQDHYMIGVQWRLRDGIRSVNELTRGPRLAAELLRYLWARKGLLSLAASHLVAFVKSDPAFARPDIQLHMMPASVDLETFAETKAMVLETKPGMTIAPCQLRPLSRGSVHLRSPSPFAAPAIVANYLAHPADLAAAVAGVRIARRIAAQPAIAPIVSHEVAPGAEVENDEALEDFVRVGGTTLYHPVGTCAMGTGSTAVVDAELRVHDVDGLRVVDASIMPLLVSGNTNAPTMMIAEKAADMILGRQKTSIAA